MWFSSSIVIRERISVLLFFIFFRRLGRKADLSGVFRNQICGAFLGLRFLYNFLYVGIEDQTLSWTRTVVWNTSIGLCMMLLFRAGNVLVDGKRVVL